MRLKRKVLDVPVRNQNERLLQANGEIAGAAKVMEELARGLVDKEEGKAPS